VAEAAEAKPLLADTKTAPAADVPDAQTRCAKALQSKRTKDVLAACPDALAADPSAADVAVALAKIEFDRGHAAQASMWSKKALAADPNAADAYVFLGGAEQTAGHGKAAKEAYKHYLQLAPTGRYAGDLRAIVGGL
jgi:Tfp pilus assembly protein PilF